MLSAHSGAHMSADEQEAKSIRYVDALRIIRLSSGRWAIWDMLSGALRIREKLDEAELTLMFEEQRKADEEIRARVRVRASAPPKPQSNKIEINLGELDL